MMDRKSASSNDHLLRCQFFQQYQSGSSIVTGEAEIETKMRNCYFVWLSFPKAATSRTAGPYRQAWVYPYGQHGTIWEDPAGSIEITRG